MAINEGFKGGSDEGEETYGELVYLDVEKLARSKFDDGLILNEGKEGTLSTVERWMSRLREHIEVVRTVWLKR